MLDNVRTRDYTWLTVKYDNRIEIRISTEEKKQLEELARDMGVDAAQILRAGARFLYANRKLTQTLIAPPILSKEEVDKLP